jgi:hypothetical protein
MRLHEPNTNVRQPRHTIKTNAVAAAMFLEYPHALGPPWDAKS